jgi:TPP-dependent 2-oxoacid decarboxylase
MRFESSNCLIFIGALMTDINFSISPTPIEPSRSIYVTSEKLSIKHHNFENVHLRDFLTKMIEAPLVRKDVVLATRQDDNGFLGHKKPKDNSKTSV